MRSNNMPAVRPSKAAHVCPSALRISQIAPALPARARFSRDRKYLEDNRREIADADTRMRKRPLSRGANRDVT